MSNPPNPLAAFRSYAYHHYLLVADGMNTATELGNLDDLAVFTRRSNLPDDQRYRARSLDSEGEQRYVVLVDGTKDVQFYIQSASWQTIIAPNGGKSGNMRADTIEVDGSLTIIEPLGIRFLEILANSTKELGVDPSGFIFILKTVFVGIRDDGNEELISNVRPFFFTMTDVTSVMDTGGSTYTMAVVGVNNGTAKLPQISRIADGVNIQVTNAMTVATALTRLEEILNKKYADFKKCLQDQLKTANSPLDLEADFRDVKYEITFDGVYKGTEYKVGDNIVVSGQDNAGDAIIGCGKNGTVDTAIRGIMGSSKRVQADADGTTAENKKYIYKIISTIKPVADVTSAMVVQYHVSRYEIIIQNLGEQLNPAPGEFIEFNYFFTGLNTDVLEFDIKMDMGLSFFYTAATSQNLAQTQTDDIRGIDNSRAATGANSCAGTADPTAAPNSESPTTVANQNALPERNPKTPLFLGTTIKDPIVRNKAAPLSSATFDALLSRHAAFENIEAQMKITGNPRLLDETTPKPEEVEGGGVTGPGEFDADENDPNRSTGLGKMFTTPALIKVNIKFPANNELEGVKDFWYKGFYNLYSITQNFDGGMFTQDISMFSLPQSDGCETALATAITTPANTEQRTADSQVGSALDNPPTKEC